MGVFLIAVAAWLARVEDWRSYTPLAGGGTVGGTAEQYVSEEKPSGVIRWLTTVDHKDIGMLYGAYALVAFAVGGLMVVLMRIELADPSMTLISNTFYNSLLTSHGITMLFLFGTPIIAAFSNYFIPLLIGADDMAFPRINAIAFWLLPPAALLIWAGFFPIPDVIPAQTAWTMYTPLSAGVGSGNQMNAGVDLMLLGLHLSGVSATMGAINFIATIFTERDEKVSWANLDIFSWTILTQSGLILFAFPLLGSAIAMLLLDRNFGTMFFSVDGGAILWQHLFWFFGHPEVYILVLPPMGIVSLVLPRFAGRRLFGFKFVVYSTLAIGVLSFGVWAHHMFATGIDPRLRASFMAVSLAIAIPSAVKTFNWITTMWNGKIRLTTPMLFCIGFVSNFIIGGVTGVFLASIPVDLVLHDTYYVVGHFHYIVMGAIAFAGFAGLYYWFPIYTGRMYQVTLGKWHFWLSMVGTNLTFFAMILLGYGGMPRRYATYLPQFATLHQVATVGALILLVGQMIFVWNFVQSWLEGRKVEDGDPWDLADDDLTTAEWTWFERKLETAVTDGGEDETELATDGGQTVDDADADANSADDA
ncbi:MULTISPECIES: cbb3-type cytochrome c oxidase subunit I [Haloferax]|uniref:Cytochrome-c oxidase n=4 Tax=Haloferax TaxID=2251 RepID=A0A558G9Q3_HALVO|nr:MULTISPECIES: cbb3-type cytochrome c oxidase subunit I [Haloferax]ELZ72724.1 cox-type terminal oxidase subunit I [Haloferax lucentense DSM 14919]ELZ92230.1 cox-type terminal oxidase subunit I [Haloferax alexandrinus JCM 10717]MBC9985688.1 cytochrome-c oxidase [Haloferax sp. AS1]NLV01838.1 cytochrome-c oxidase [Haloferax alexandrinus]RDZ33502.1 cytochrome-c oxidase [Haloferax sp. Atlit-48N]